MTLYYSAMNINITKAQLANVEPLRQLFLAGIDFQFVYNKCHGAGWSDVYLFTIDGMPVGYGSVWGENKREDRDTIFEFYMGKPFLKHSRQIFTAFVKKAGAGFVKCQTNDHLLCTMLFESAVNIKSENILFKDGFKTTLHIPGAQFVKNENPDGDITYDIQYDGEIVATGGYVWNYNFPFIDIYYEVKEKYRQNGYGSFLTQELKKEAYRLNRIPAARCDINNQASKATLFRAGMQVCGYMLIGETDKQHG
jgi:hypothetical protein